MKLAEINSYIETLISDIQDAQERFNESVLDLNLDSSDEIEFEIEVEDDTDETESADNYAVCSITGLEYTPLQTSDPLSKGDKVRKRFEFQRIPLEYELRNCDYPGLTAKGLSNRIDQYHQVYLTSEDVVKRVADLRNYCGVDVEKNKVDVDGKERTFYFIP